MSLKKRVEELEKEINELRKQLLTLAMQREVTFVDLNPDPNPEPYTVSPVFPYTPYTPYRWTTPNTTITCGESIGGIQSKQNLS